jgi:hypothetical protein
LEAKEITIINGIEFYSPKSEADLIALVSGVSTVLPALLPFVIRDYDSHFGLTGLSRWLAFAGGPRPAGLAPISAVDWAAVRRSYDDAEGAGSTRRDQFPSMKSSIISRTASTIPRLTA